MRKCLLIAAAALLALTANAQRATQAKQKSLPATTFRHYEAVPAKNVGKPELIARHVTNNRITPTESLTKTLSPSAKFKNVSFGPAKASDLQPVYNAYGSHVTDGPMSWEMSTGVVESEDGTTTNILIDVIPDPFGFEGGVAVEYTQNRSEIIIAPQLVASNEEGTMFVFLESASSEDGSITLNLGDDGRITGSYSILYGAYSSEDYNSDNYLGYYGNYLQGIKYSLPGETVVPEMSFEPSNLVIFAGLGLNGYSYNSNLAITSAYAPLSFRNTTADPSTAWEWSMGEMVGEDSVGLSGNEWNYSVNTIGEGVYTNPQLIGYNREAVSEPYKWAVGKTIDEKTNEPRYENVYIYAAGAENNFILNGETPAIMTRQDPDGDLTFYTNWGTPDIASNSMSKIYCYHEKPSTPLFITGVTLPLVSFESKNDFELKIIIYKATRNTPTSKPILGEIIAQGEATSANINSDFNIGLTAVEFTDLYVEDEMGMSETIDHLFIDSDFVICIDGWDNGTFSGVLGSQDVPNDNSPASTYFEMSGEEGSMYSYTSWKTSLFVGLLGATYGYLYTEDDTNVVLPTNGGEATLHITPMYYSNSEEEGVQTRLFLESVTVNGEVIDEVPDWLEINYTNPTPTGEFDKDGNEYYDSDFDLQLTAEALPIGEESRKAEIVLWQEGAKLTITITQGGDEQPFQPFAFTGAEGKYYLCNIMSEKFWGAGNSWGTQASLVDHPEYVILHPQEDGTYIMETQVSNGGTAYYFEGDYMDNGSPKSLTITAVEEIGENDITGETVYAYTIADGENCYGWDGENTVMGKGLSANNVNALWVIASEAEAIEGLAAATAEDPMDATFLILDPNFGRNNRNQSAWTGDEFSVGGDNTNFNAEKWGGNSQTFDISQTVDAPNGLYEISWNGYYRYNNTTDNTNDVAIAAHADGTEVINSFIYINGNDYPLTSIADEAASAALEGALPFSQGDASNAFGKGLYAQSATVIVTDGKLTIGIKKTNHPGCDWTVWDNFELTYYGPTTNNPDEPAPVAPEGWTSVVNNGNLAGNDVANYIAKEYPSTEPVGATIVDGAGVNNSRGIVVKSQDKVSQAWDSQFWIQVNEKLPEGTKLHVEFDYKADVAGSVGTQAHGLPGNYQHWAAIGNVDFGTEWKHLSTDIEVSGEMATGNGGDGMLSIAFNLNDIAEANNFYFDNFGVWIQKPAPVDDWTNILHNSDLEGTQVINFFSKEAPSAAVVPATIYDGAGVDGSRGIKVVSAAAAANDWDTQFWIYLPTTLPEGTKYKVEFDYKADRDASADTQAHGEPGNYIFYSMIGSPSFTTEWQHYEKEGSISADQAEAKTDGVPNGNKFRSIAFNLSKDKDNEVTYFFDNVKFFVEKSFDETGITNVNANNAAKDAIYNLRGQKVQQAQKGLYIINGKKYVK